jgi:hypothetical protein
VWAANRADDNVLESFAIYEERPAGVSFGTASVTASRQERHSKLRSSG